MNSKHSMKRTYNKGAKSRGELFQPDKGLLCAFQIGFFPCGNIEGDSLRHSPRTLWMQCKSEEA